jgi:hypothetical protein
MPSLTRQIPNDSETARLILREVRINVQRSLNRLSNKHKEWKEAEERTLAYLPEREIDLARKRERENGLPQYTTIQIPYSYAVLMSAHTYLTSVFMGRNPVLQFTGRHGESMQQTQALEALIDYQVMVGRFMVPLYTWLYDAGKYGIGVIGEYWEEKIEQVSTVEGVPETDQLGNPTGKILKQQRTIRQRTYQGNKIYNVQPWDFLWDTRVPARDFQKGEYCANRFALSWNECKRREQQGFYMNLDKLAPGDTGDLMNTFDAGAAELDRPESTTNTFIPWEETSAISRKRPSLVRGYECYIEIIPKEWGLSESDYPEKWVFTCSADFKTLIGAQPLGALHCQFPYHILPLECEGYGLVPRGFPRTLEAVQNTIDWLLNSHFYNIRAALNNKIVVDPSRVVMKDVLDPLPGGVIRLKPAAYGTDTNAVMHQMAITDVTQNHIRDLQMMLGIGERTVGINDQIMGMLNAGGRKTATEVRTSTSFGVNRLKTIAEWFSAVGFDPLAQMTVQNTQQYYDGEMKFKIAGDLMLNAGAGFVTVTPDKIMGMYDFVPVDGTLPIDRFAQANLWQQLLGQMRTMPEIMMQYDMAGIFTWVAQLAGLKNINQFKIQVAPDQVLAMQAQRGNVVGMNGRGPQPASARPNAAEVIEPGQVPGMGATG